MEIPDNVRQTLAVVAKYHFWILAAIVPLIALVVLWLGNSALADRITGQRQKIQSALGQISSVTGVAPHPNAEWTRAIDGETARIAGETLAEWQRLWDGQAALRKWPEDLGEKDFLPAVAALPPGGKLERMYLAVYQKRAPRFVRSLPARMGVKDEMNAKAVSQPATPVAASQPATPAVWNPADQQRLYQSFDWVVLPSTTQVLVAQEELWVYGALCDLIRQLNAEKLAAGSREPPIPWIEELAVGYRATKDSPAAGAARIFIPAGTAQAAAAGPVDGEGFSLEQPSDASGAGPTEAAVNPRFEAGAKAANETAYRNHVYVDFSGKPLTAAQLGTVPDARMVHLVPFVFKGVIDQRDLDGFLAALASSELPIDVREVRINPGAKSGSAAGGRAAPGGAGAAKPGQQSLSRRHDVRVELRGTVALATPPDKAATGTAAAATAEEGT